ncbi:SLATT domain-containing protein [Methylophilus methylotrophus]|uniref:SLATT domain-containing protein n=1 Tax=Methylophilus methylotrophus TaxID=17 RepID=UPI00037E96EC|nr:SLATT domain-containing protein [Methylophilus methylotrophus]
MIKQCWYWLLSLNERERAVKDASEKLQMSMRTTAKCRYNAAGRLQSQGKFAFFTTTSLSLGLIFIPLMQNSGIPLAFKASVLNMMVIFLAVAVLVYSVVIGTARYELRAENLTECGDKLKELIREIDKDREANNKIGEPQLAKYQERYSDIVTDTENHIRSDYRLAMLEMTRDYYITGLPRMSNYILAYSSRFSAYIVPLIMILFEIIFITDMIGMTKIIIPYFNGVDILVDK